jgi:hypothetical protein
MTEHFDYDTPRWGVVQVVDHPVPRRSKSDVALVRTATVSAMKFTRLLASVPLLLVGALLALYGLFALSFNDRGGATYVTLAGHRYNADIVGVVSLVIALTMIAAGVLIVRRRSGF